MPRILIIRHAQSEANLQRILMGSKLDSPLSPHGKQAASNKGSQLKEEGFRPDAVFTSALTRTKETANIIISQLDLDLTIIELAELNERDFGQYDGKPYEQVIEAFDHFGPNPPTVEQAKYFIERVQKGLETVKKAGHDTTLVVTHSNVVNVLQAALFQPDKLENYWELPDPSYCEGFIYNF